MSELQKISIDGVDYNVADLTDQQKGILSHITDIEQKLGGLQFQASQLSVAKEAFVGMLKQSLEAKAE